MLPYIGGYYTCNNYMKDAAEGTLVGEAKSAHDAEAIALACKKEGTLYFVTYTDILGQISSLSHYCMNYGIKAVFIR